MPHAKSPPVETITLPMSYLSKSGPTAAPPWHRGGTRTGLGGDWLLYGFIALAFVMTSSSFYYVFAGAPDHSGGSESASARGNPLYLLLWASLYVVTIAGFVVSILNRGLQPSILSVVPLIALIFASMGWSVSSSETGFFGLMLTLNILLSYVLSQLAPPKLFLSVLAKILIALTILSLLLFIIAPQMVSVDRWGGGWISAQQLLGVFAHKSDAGTYFAILVLLMSKGVALGYGRRARYTMLVIAMLGIVLSNSATALVAAIATSGFLFVFKSRSTISTIALVAMAGAVILFSVTVPMINFGALAEMVGREATLTGRSDIWPLSTRFIEERPLLGYGYYGFFNKSVFSPAWSLWEHFEYFFTPHFHNSAIDVTISLGLIGLFMYVTLLGFAFAIGGNGTIDLASRRLCFGILILYTITACFDFTLMKHNSFATMFMFYCLFAGQTRYDHAST